MGSVTAVWREPRTYAKFLGLEPGSSTSSGCSSSWRTASAGLAEALTHRRIRAAGEDPIQPGPAGLLTAAEAAVKQLAAAGGVDVAAPAHVTTPAQRNTHDREIILVAVLGALGLAAGARYLIRRSR